MQLHHVIPAALALPRDSNAHRRGMFAALELRGMTLALTDDHVAAVTAASLEVTAAGSAVLDGRNHFDEVVADRQQRIFQPEHPNPGIDVTDLESKHSLEVVDDGRELVGDQRNLAKSNRHGILLLNC